MAGFQLGSTPWRNGNYICNSLTIKALLVEGENVTQRGTIHREGDVRNRGSSWKYGHFGEANPMITEATGTAFYNWKSVTRGNLKKLGVVSDDGKKVTFINIFNAVDTYNWVSEEEFKEFENSGDPAEAPPNHYNPQPHNLGKFLYLSGAPGFGKSSTGLFLSKLHGFVYYEGDAFLGGFNPYLPPQSKEPSRDILKQKRLKDLPQERINGVADGFLEFFSAFLGKEYDLEKIKLFLGAQCRDIDKERKRIGGDWVVAQAVPTRAMRDFIRTQLGPQLVFVILNMGKEQHKGRINARHGERRNDGTSEINQMFLDAHLVFEPADEDEPNTINLYVTQNMTREEVVEKVLEMSGRIKAEE